jgi:hypothetical protein
MSSSLAENGFFTTETQRAQRRKWYFCLVRSYSPNKKPCSLRCLAADRCVSVVNLIYSMQSILFMMDGSG